MGVVGLGEGRSILSALGSSPFWEVGGICDLDEALCRERAAEFDLPGYTLSYEELLADPGIDVVGIYTPDQLHGKHIRMALAAGKDVVCTKPVLASLAEAWEVREAQRASGKMVFVGQSSRFFEPMVHQRRDFEAGRHGELQAVETHYHTDGRWFLEKGWSRQKGFSWMVNFLIHAVDLARWYLPEIEEVSGYGTRGPHTAASGLDCADTMTFLLKDRRGRFASVSGSYGKPNLDSEAEAPIVCILRGSDGISKAEYSRLVYSTHFEGEGHRVQDFSARSGYYFRFGGLTHHAGEYQNYIDYVAASLAAGTVPKPDLDEALGTLAVLEAMGRCLAGSMVRVSLIRAEFGLEG